MLKSAYSINNRRAIEKLENLIKGGLSNLKLKLKKCLMMKLKLKSQIR